MMELNHLEFEHVVDHPSHFMGSRNIGLRWTETTFQAAVEGPKGTIRTDDCRGCLAKGLPGTVIGLQCVEHYQFKLALNFSIGWQDIKQHLSRFPLS